MTIAIPADFTLSALMTRAEALRLLTALGFTITPPADARFSSDYWTCEAVGVHAKITMILSGNNLVRVDIG